MVVQELAGFIYMFISDWKIARVRVAVVFLKCLERTVYKFDVFKILLYTIECL